jgi:hypothetical protein
MKIKILIMSLLIVVKAVGANASPIKLACQHRSKTTYKSDIPGSIPFVNDLGQRTFTVTFDPEKSTVDGRCIGENGCCGEIRVTDTEITCYGKDRNGTYTERINRLTGEYEGKAVGFNGWENKSYGSCAPLKQAF